VIFMSGYAAASALENGTIGSNALLLSKPFSTEVLAQKITEVQQNTGITTSKNLAARSSG
jgi:hypothetical protein